MSKPTTVGLEKFKRIGRYLKGNRRFVQVFRFQGPCGYVDVYVDANCADCLATRKSTSGGVVIVGVHVLGCWSCTQSTIALSSAESEYIAIVRGSAEGIGLCSVLMDFRTEASLRVWTDSSAARSICLRQGIGHVKHLATKILWVQQRVKRKELQIMKEKTEKNTADLMTKYLTNDRTQYLMKMLTLEARDGCHPRALKVGVDLEKMSNESMLLQGNIVLGENVPVLSRKMDDDADNDAAEEQEVLAVLARLSLDQ